MLQPIVDTYYPSYTVMTEDRRSLPPGIIMRVGGRSQTSDTKNENNRVYKRSLWEKTLNDPAIKTKIAERRMFGKLGHPKDEDASKPEDVSHIVTEARLEPDGSVYCQYDILDTPHGHVAATLHRAKAGLGTSSRGKGSTIVENGLEVVNEADYALSTWDFVLEPSTPGAYPRVLSEAKEAEERTRVREPLLKLINEATDTKVIEKCASLGAEIRDSVLVEHALAKLSQRANGEGAAMPHAEIERVMTAITALTEATDSMKKDIAFVMSQAASKKYKCESCHKEFVRDGRSLPEGGPLTCPHCNATGTAIRPVAESAQDNVMLAKRLESAERLLGSSLQMLQRYKLYESRAKAEGRILEALLDTLNQRETARVAGAVLRHTKPAFAPMARRLLGECKTKSDVRRVWKTLSETGGAAVSAAKPIHEQVPALKATTQEEFSRAVAGLKGEPNTTDPDTAVLEYKDGTGKLIARAAYAKGKPPAYSMLKEDRKPQQIAEGVGLTPIGPNVNEVVVGGTRILFSYRTPVAYSKGGENFRTDKAWSSTTTRHINRWLGGAQAKTVPQSDLDSLLASVTTNEAARSAVKAKINEAEETPPPESSTPPAADTGKKTGTPGSISWGTMRLQDLLPRFLDELEDLDADKAKQVQQEIKDAAKTPLSDLGADDDWWQSDLASDILAELFDALDEHAPAGHYFGASEGDGSDYGFWGTDDESSKDEAKRTRRVGGAKQRAMQQIKRNRRNVNEAADSTSREPLPGQNRGVDTGLPVLNSPVSATADIMSIFRSKVQR